MLISLKKKLIKFAIVPVLTAITPASFAQPVTMSLDSSNPEIRWKIAPQQEVKCEPAGICRVDYETNSWVTAIVPGTVFSSCVAAGLEEDPNFGDNIYRMEKAKYDRPFFYRTEFDIPSNFNREKLWLNFEGVNRKGDVWLNGSKLGTLDGFMQRGKFDITSLIRKRGKNVLVVLVQIPEQPLNNYGSPTYLSSAGWDWMPHVPGLNSGITDNVFISNSGGLLIRDPWVRTDLPTNARAELSVSLDVVNPTASYQEGELEMTINPGNIKFSKKIGVPAGRTSSIKLDRSICPDLVVNNPKLWWPNGYGGANLYTCDLTLTVGGKISESRQVTFGIKKYTYDTEEGVLQISVNGKRIFIKGGNWGMSEYLLRCRGKEYDTRVRLHREMNFNMIRNWLGSVTDDEFYEACDRYGILVWDDFWLNANPVLPSDIHCFNINAIEKILRVRNHPSIAVWCGNNEGFPVPPLNNWLRENISVFDGNDRLYQATSNSEGLSGSGFWGNFDPRWYFTPRPGSSSHGNLGWGFRTEIGTAVFPNYESLRKFLPDDKLWPRNKMWDQHFFGPSAFNAMPDKYDAFITRRYGAPEGIEDYCRKAQLLNIETNQAMYEGWADNIWENASGIMTWMSQPAYPSMVWQTYDYYYDLTGAFWGAKKGCEPLHIQWNPANNSVKVINTTSKDREELMAEVAVYNSDGSEVEKYRQSVVANAPLNTATHCFTLPFYNGAEDIALHKPVTASSSDGGRPEEVTDGDPDSRWSSQSNDDQWICIDLQQQENIFGVGLNWEAAYGKSFRIEVSDDAKTWKSVSTVDEGRPGIQEIFFDDVRARYVRMRGEKRATGWGYSLWDFKVFGGTAHLEGLSTVHFIKLKLKDGSGKLISENMYWRGTNRTDFTALNSLPEVGLVVKSKVTREKGKCYIQARIANPSSSPAIAFAVWLQLHHSKTNERILPAIMSDNYFTLLKGETRDVRIEFDEDLLNNGGEPVLTASPYNNRKIK